MITLQLEDVFLDKPSEVVVGRTVKGWMVDSVLKEHMHTENRAPETMRKLKRLSELAKAKLSGSMKEKDREEYGSLIKELSEVLPEDDIAVEEAVLMSINEILGEKH